MGGGGILEGHWAPSAFALFLVQVLVIIFFCRVLRKLLSYIALPAVVAEMLAGIVIGPTVLGRAPGWSESLFPPASISVLSVVSNFFLCYFLFLVGLELDIGKIKTDFRKAALISLGGLLAPFVGSLLLSLWLYNNPDYSNTSFIVLALFFTCALGISALPVLARILAERRMLTTRIGSLALSVAALDDVSGPLLGVTACLSHACPVARSPRAFSHAPYISLTPHCRALFCFLIESAACRSPLGRSSPSSSRSFAPLPVWASSGRCSWRRARCC
jgi:Kef-type K+ transport system membrane component KefB